MSENQTEKVLLPEVVEQPVETQPLRRKKLSVRNMRIAELAARGWSPEEIAREVGRSRERIYEILKTDDVWEYIKDVIRDTFSEGDRILAYLYKKAMKGLDIDLSSSDPEVRQAARADIFKQWGYGRDKVVSSGEKAHISLFQQIFMGREGAPTGSIIESIDDIILQKRKERGLPLEPEDEEEWTEGDDKINK